MKRELLDLAERTFLFALDTFACSLLLAIWIAKRARVIDDARRFRAWLLRAFR